MASSWAFFRDWFRGLTAGRPSLLDLKQQQGQGQGQVSLALDGWLSGFMVT